MGRFDEFIGKAVPVLMKHGCQHTLLILFEILGGKDDLPQGSFFNRVSYELLSRENIGEFTITRGDIDMAKANANFRVSHLAALNPSGAGLKFLLA